MMKPETALFVQFNCVNKIASCLFFVRGLIKQSKRTAKQFAAEKVDNDFLECKIIPLNDGKLQTVVALFRYTKLSYRTRSESKKSSKVQTLPSIAKTIIKTSTLRHDRPGISYLVLMCV